MAQSHERAITFRINQGERDGYLLAVLDGVALYEYEMPRGSTALRFVYPDGGEKTVAYRSLSLRWLKAAGRAAGRARRERQRCCNNQASVI
jgi:hypothetical protein